MEVALPYSSGVFSRLYSWVTDRNNGVKIQAVRMDAEFDGIATALSTAILKDGTQTITQNIPFNDKRITGLADSTAFTDALNKRTADKVVATAGTSTAYTATSGYSLTDANVIDGTSIKVRPNVASGATPTIAVDTMTARAIRRQDGLQIGANELVADSTYELAYRTSNTSWYVIGASLPTISGNGGRFLRANSGATALEFAASGSVARTARTSNTILAFSDIGTLIDVTSGTFTQTLAAAATLGAGWWCWFKNSGTGIVTLDPNASETIEGATTILVYPNEVFAIQCDGSNFFTIGRQSMVYLGSAAVSGTPATFDIEFPFSDTELMRLDIDLIAFSGDAISTPRLRLKVGGAYVTTSNYRFNTYEVRAGGTGAVNGSSAASSIQLANGASGSVAAATVLNGRLSILNKDTATNAQHSVAWQIQLDEASDRINGAGCVTTGAALQGIRFFYSSGNVDAGTAHIWGWRS